MGKGITIGLTRLHYALLLDDPLTGSPSYTTPKRITGVVSANINPNVNKSTFFGDNGPMEVASALGEIELALNVGDIPLEDQAVLLGHTLVNGVLVKKSSDIAPWVAVGFESLKSNGRKRFTWLVKGKFQEPESNNETKTDNVNFQAPTINASFVMRDNDDVWQYHADEDASGYVASVGSNWFTAVYTGSVPAAVTVTTVPANVATAVAVGTTVKWTFSTAINPAFLSAMYFGLYKTAGMVQVAGAYTINAANTEVTFTPGAALTAATGYTTKVDMSVGLTADSTTTFTTA